jgi:molybdopterin-guanine dinucleotide biosynthesis protein A
MGRDKAGVLIDGIPMGRIAVLALLGAGLDQVAVVGGGECFGVEHLPDAVEGGGPLGGIRTAAQARPGETLVVLPCDLPRIDADAVRQLLRAAADHPDAPLVLATVDGDLSWPIGVWRPDGLEVLGRIFDAGDRSFRPLNALLRPVLVELGARGADADTPSELPS